MRVIDIRRTINVNSIDDLAHVLSQRCESEYNAFWLTPNESEYPTLTVLVQNEIASLNFLESEDEPGFNSIGCVPSLAPDGDTVFRTSENRADDVEIANDSIVTVPKAIEAAKEFSKRNTCRSVSIGLSYSELRSLHFDGESRGHATILRRSVNTIWSTLKDICSQACTGAT